MKLGIFIVLALSCMVFNANALTFYRLESFLDFREIFLSVPINANPAYAWWTPYYDTPTNPDWVAPINTATGYILSAGSLGGQRDQIIGFEITSNRGATASLVSRPSNRIGACYYTLGFVGGGYWQWDGVDDVGANAQPAKANALPGIGSNTNYAYLPAHAAGGATIDLTLGGAVKALNFEALTDLDCEYTWDFFDANNRSAKYTVSIATSGTYLPYQILFSRTTTGAGFVVDIDAGWGGFNRVAAIQLAVYTFQSATNAIDTEFRNLTFVGYQVTGNVVVDCDCTTANGIDRSVQNQPMTLRTGTGTTPTGTVLFTTNTDASGNFVFTGMDSGTYQVCLESPISGLSLCSGQTTCRPITLTGFVDPTPLSYVVLQPPTLTPPGPVTIECGACTDATVACTGVATLSDCNTGSTPVTSFQDTPSGSGCTRSISRRFFSGSVSATQVITILDRTSPVLITPATSQSPQCNALTPTFSAWLANFGGATWTDCTSFTVSNGNPTGPAGCGTVTVTFTANDPCGTPGTPTTASYTILDSTDPTLDTPASAGTATCNTNGSDLTAFNTWLSTRGGAVASDNCGTPTWTNNYSTLTPLTRGCNNAVTVTFTASDACGRFVQTSNSFTISDNVGPSASGATSPNDSCDANTNTRFNTWLNNNGNAVATDTCTASNLLTWTEDFTGASFPLGCRNSVTVTFTVFDQCSRTSSVTGTYTVTDNTAPRITRAPDNLNLACDSANQNGQISTWLAAQGNAVAVDDCTGSVIWTNNFATITTNCGSNTVTFTACDVCNPANCATTTALFSITDGQAPTYSTPPTSTTVPCDTNTESAFNAWINSGAGAVLIDNCDTDSIRFTNDNSGGFPFGCNAARTVNFNAVDACGNSATTVSATFRVTDNRAPIIQNVAQPLTVECNSNANSQYQTWRSNRGGATANDECAATVTWRDNGPASVSLPTVGCSNTVTVTFIGSDGCANEVFSTAAFTITDTVRPVISPGASPLTNECTGSSNDQSITTWLANNGGARATDACSQITWENNFDGLSGGCVSSATVVFTATDACGLASTTSAVYSISDTAAPVINPPAQPFTSQCGPNTNQDFVNWVNNHGGAVADDACQALSSLVWSDDIGDVTFSTCGRRTVTFTVTDPCDRSASTTAEFIVADATAPAFNPSARDLSVECQKTGNQADYNNWLATRGGAIATDSCAVQLVYANNAPSVGPSRCASQTVTFTASDNCNNVGRTTATFSVVDSSAPVFTHFPLTRLADCSDPATNTASLNSWLTNFAGANAVDACTPSSELVYTATPQGADGTGCVTRQNFLFTVTDSCGRSVSETASFITADIEDPFFTIEPSNATFVCDGQGNVNEIADWIDSNGGGSAADQCQGTIEWSNNYRGVGPFTCTSNLVTFVVSDGCGNDIAKTVLLTITDDEPPVFSDVPEDITVRCDIDTHPEFLGYPSAFDICTGNPIITFEDFESDEPPIGNCPGNHLILRTFSTFDECGNVATVDQLITVNLTRSAGPCDPEGCVCDDCCPDAAPSNCLPSTCQATPCRATPCTASTCLCPVVAKAATAVKAADELPQCEPIYIHVHDDDDTTSQSADALREPTMLVTNRLIDFKNKSDASVISFSVLLFFVMFFLF